MSEKKPEKAVIPVAMTERGVQLHTIDEAWRFCTAIEQSGIAPKGMTAASIFAVVQAGAELGLTPFRALSNMKIINGRVGPMGTLAKALVRRENVLRPGTGFEQKYVGKEFDDDYTASIKTHRDGETEPYVTSFSVRDAKKAGLWGKPGPWSQYPKRMLMWRAVGFHMDDYYSDVLMGLHIAEVLGDYPPERTKVVMEKLSEPAVDPLLDELAEIGKDMQPPDDDGPALDTSFNTLIGPDGKEILKINPEEAEPFAAAREVDKKWKEARQARPVSDPVGEALKELGQVLQDDELEPPDPGNAAEEGEETGELF